MYMIIYECVIEYIVRSDALYVYALSVMCAYKIGKRKKQRVLRAR